MELLVSVIKEMESQIQRRKINKENANLLNEDHLKKIKLLFSCIKNFGPYI